MKKVIIYTKNNCGKCMEAKFGLKAAQVEFEERNIEAKEEYRKEFDAYGYSAAPVTVFPSGNVLAGFERKEFEDELGF
ncbi:glutaredoxin family protein [Bacillus thuringiensis]|uniref:glutaredoxin family protein n=1 Tax=Bacillus thuringiensis TaxID=1428 RepID=UPI0037D45B94